jgi:hypothetical protein
VQERIKGSMKLHNIKKEKKTKKDEERRIRSNGFNE